jgi:hypothetical protein
MLPEVMMAAEEEKEERPPAVAPRAAASTPVLLVHGELDGAVPAADVRRTEALLLTRRGGGGGGDVRRHEVGGKRAHAMPGSAAEMRPVFEFLSQRLRGRQWALEAAGDCASWHEVPPAAAGD